METTTFSTEIFQTLFEHGLEVTPEMAAKATEVNQKLLAMMNRRCLATREATRNKITENVIDFFHETETKLFTLKNQNLFKHAFGEAYKAKYVPNWQRTQVSRSTVYWENKCFDLADEKTA